MEKKIIVERGTWYEWLTEYGIRYTHLHDKATIGPDDGVLFSVNCRHIPTNTLHPLKIAVWGYNRERAERQLLVLLNRWNNQKNWKYWL